MSYPSRKILDVKNPAWSSANNGTIDLDIKWTNSNDEYWRFTASPDDPVDYGRALFKAASDGEYGDIEPFDHEAHEQQQARRQVTLKLRTLERQIAPLRDEALAGIISDDDRANLASLVRQSKELRQQI
ncbi:hypothetical protein LMG33818_002617 [Halomonadaceae bacterium LMG 33818]|uniref:hypothetical protein n=1 Tax=Cernens ardua TaxID=3402176 RepID=UPI003EDB93C1